MERNINSLLPQKKENLPVCLKYLVVIASSADIFSWNLHIEYLLKKFNSRICTVIEKDHLGDWSPEKDCC